ncbi:MAG TPA: heme NO-binding domain-containing protein [Ktedonobacteraceae bacterium]|nr:heme NO-binding domain-containing protein [Ktedonobacteraceae bacterium]
MHGLIFATWEKFLADRYGEVALGIYRSSIAGTGADIPLVTRTYPDEVLLKGVTATSKVTGVAPSILLYLYGEYFITNNFTSHVCSHLLEGIHSARDLLLTMRMAHQQLNHASSEIVPPLFQYEPLTGLGIHIIYDSHRHLCPILYGAIEGAGKKYSEVVAVQEIACMQKGDDDCQFDVHFLGKWGLSPTADVYQLGSNAGQRKMAETIFHMLPSEGLGITLHEVSSLLALHGHSVRPSQIVGIMRQLQNVGLVILSAKQTGDIFSEREYLKVSKVESGAGRMLRINVS